MAVAAGYPRDFSPAPGSPIKAHRHVPDSPLYRPAQGQGLGYGQGQGQPPDQGKGHSPRDDPRNDPRHMREPSPPRPRSYGREANVRHSYYTLTFTYIVLQA